MHYSSNPNVRLAKWQWIALFATLTGLLLVTMVLPIIAQYRERATHSERGAASFEAPDLLDHIGAPPGAQPAAFRTVESGPRRTLTNGGEAWESWSHLHETEQTFEEVLAWYLPRLAAAGWRRHVPASAIGAAFCNAPWHLKFKPMPPRAGASARSHWFELRLELNNQSVTG